MNRTKGSEQQQQYHRLHAAQRLHPRPWRLALSAWGFDLGRPPCNPSHGSADARTCCKVADKPDLPCCDPKVKPLGSKELTFSVWEISSEECCHTYILQLPLYASGCLMLHARVSYGIFNINIFSYRRMKDPSNITKTARTEASQWIRSLSSAMRRHQSPRLAGVVVFCFADVLMFADRAPTPQLSVSFKSHIFLLCPTGNRRGQRSRRCAPPKSRRGFFG